MTKADAQRYADEFIECFAFGMTPSGSEEFLMELGLWPEADRSNSSSTPQANS